MTWMLLPAFVLPVALTWLILDRFWPDAGKGSVDLILKLSLAGPIGLGFSSLYFFAWCLIFTPSGRGLVVFEMIMLTVAIILVVIGRRRYRRDTNESGNLFTDDTSTRKPEVGRVIQSLVLISCLGLTGFSFVARIWNHPHGLWDAWAIWNLRARFLYRSAEHWTDSFSRELFWSSPDHPLGLPGLIARTWKYLGNESVTVPMLVAGLFFVCTVGLLYAAVAKLSGRTSALSATLCLVGTPLFVTYGASQYADVPAGFFLLATVVLITLYDRSDPNRPGWLILAGLTLSLAIWTKNEGWLLLVAVTGSRLVMALTHRNIMRIGREMGHLLWGASAALVMVTILKVFLVPPSGLFATQDWNAIGTKLVDLSRYATVGQSFLQQMSLYGNGMSLALVGGVVLLGPNWHRLRSAQCWSGFLTLGIMLTGFFFIYIITPENLDWHLRTSLDRILLQIWPMTIFLFWQTVGRPSGVQLPRTNTP